MSMLLVRKGAETQISFRGLNWRHLKGVYNPHWITTILKIVCSDSILTPGSLYVGEDQVFPLEPRRKRYALYTNRRRC